LSWALTLIRVKTLNTWWKIYFNVIFRETNSLQIARIGLSYTILRFNLNHTVKLNRFSLCQYLIRKIINEYSESLIKSKTLKSLEIRMVWTNSRFGWTLCQNSQIFSPSFIKWVSFHNKFNNFNNFSWFIL